MTDYCTGVRVSDGYQCTFQSDHEGPCYYVPPQQRRSFDMGDNPALENELRRAEVEAGVPIPPIRHNAGTCLINRDCVLKDGHSGVCEYLPAIQQKRQYSHYFKDVSKFSTIDVYRVLVLWDVTDPCIQHAIKKLLCAGQRGAKDRIKDVKEAVVSCERFLEMQQE